MPSFLEKVAHHLLENHPNDLGEICVVFPSRRAGVFLADKLSQLLSEKGVAGALRELPQTFSFDEFLKELSGKIFPDSLTLAFEMYPAYREIFPEESFDTYYAWATTLLNDFEEAGLAMENKGELFRNLKELRALDVTIEAWNQPGKEPTAFQKEYLLLWESLPEIFSSFEKRLSEKGLSMPSLAMREMIQDPELIRKRNKWSKIWFVGFNSFSPLQEKLLNLMRKNDWADFLFDTDAYYFGNEYQEAGKFFRKLKENWDLEEISWTENLLSNNAKEIEVIGVAGYAAQAKAAGNILLKIPQEEFDRKTAIILPDESLLFPMLDSFPENVSDINVTMGLPLRSTSVYALVNALLDMHENAARHAGKNRKNAFYHKDILAIADHPLIKAFTREHSEELRKFITNENLVFATTEDLSAYLTHPIFGLLFQNQTQPVELLNNFIEIFTCLKNYLLEKEAETGFKASVELEYLFHFFSLTTRLGEKVSAFFPGMDLKTLRQVYREIIQTGSIPFSGEPLQGIQVMGMLETRALDFDNVIILSANEDLFPPGSNPPSFVPFSLRKAFGLETFEERDAIYSYHFFRLLQRAKKVFLIYNTETGTSKGKERSRYIEQISWELSSVNKNLRIQEVILSPQDKKKEIQPITVQKDEVIMQRIHKLLHENGISPSALNTYLFCTLKYYFSYILSLEEREEVEESAEANTFGSVFHSVMEELYKPFLGKEISKEDFENIFPLIHETCEQQFREVGRTRNLEYGKNRILLGVIETLANDVVRSDAGMESISIVGLEEPVRIEMETDPGIPPVILKGFIDRIDRADGELRILDYKTGRVESLKIDDPATAGENPNQKEAFQVGVYAMIYANLKGIRENMQAGVIKLREAKEGFQPALYAKNHLLSPEMLERISERVKNIIRNLRSTEVVFSQTEDETRCLYCPYKTICSRE